MFIKPDNWDTFDVAQRTIFWTQAGYPHTVAQAVAESERPFEELVILSATEIMDIYLTWEGVIGFTESIMEAVDAARKVSAAANKCAAEPIEATASHGRDGYDELLFNRDIEGAEVDLVGAKLQAEGVRYIDLDWRDSQTLWVWGDESE